MDQRRHESLVLYLAPRSASVFAMSHALPPLPDVLQREGFVFLPGDAVQPLLGGACVLRDWAAFAASWNALAVDPYLAQQGRLRRRRHATYSISREGAITRAAHRPHYQSLQYNPLQGGIERWFEPIDEDVGCGDSMRAILEFARRVFGTLAPHVPTWHVEAHQFRIEARAGEAGQPTPEGSHRDGVDYVLVLLVERSNIASGTTCIHAPDGRALGEFTLTHPFDTALLVDNRVYHGVTPVHALDPAREAHRDVLVVTFRAST